MTDWKEYLEAFSILIILLFIVTFIDIFLTQESDGYVYFEGGSFKVEISDTPRERSQGLSGREELVPESGMLFIFSRSDYHGIWMKDMNFPIDILWIDETGIIVDIQKNIHPDTYPEVFKPRRPARFVLEIPSGAVDNSELHVGQRLDLSEVSEGDL